ncbi:MAG: DHH family phosphoesterase [Deltaproteobacteria bacterium]|nr:DHH family phosphoesterase [Deltaproteobacteria bacterium]
MLIARTEFPLLLFEPHAAEEVRLLVTDDRALARRARDQGFRTATGDLGNPALYRRIGASPHDRFVVQLEAAVLNRCLSALLEADRAAAVTVLSEPEPAQAARWREEVVFLPVERLGSVCLRAELERAAARAGLAKIRQLFRGAERVLLLVQDDPDPDGLASALALRTLLGRNRQTAVIGSFGPVTRPENLAMIEALDLPVQLLEPETLAGFDRVALLDVQPFHSPNIPTEVDLVIDHHPRRTNYSAQIQDVRPRYGATSTIMTEYLLASELGISQRLATALLYGIKTDTQLLGRDTTPMDVAAFSALYPLANQGLLRRIDRPQLPRRDLDALSRAFRHAHFEGDVLFTHLGPLSREDVIPHIADFCMEVEGVGWAVVSGLFDRRLVLSVRAFGGGKNAGEVVRAAFEGYGSAGGHRASAKAVMPLENLPAEASEPEKWVRSRFLGTLAETAQSPPATNPEPAS